MVRSTRSLQEVLGVPWEDGKRKEKWIRYEMVVWRVETGIGDRIGIARFTFGKGVRVFAFSTNVYLMGCLEREMDVDFGGFVGRCGREEVGMVRREILRMGFLDDVRFWEMEGTTIAAGSVCDHNLVHTFVQTHISHNGFFGAI
jgi:hypothetical protein